MELIEKVTMCLNGTSIDLFVNDPDIEVIRRKVDKLVEIYFIMKENKNNFEKFLSKDWETEIYPLL